MQKIVYILGAGFSHPLGLPVMSDFIDMAKDLYSKDAQKYSHFSDVFKNIHEKLAWIKTVYDTDLYNIEEVLSILEMRKSLDSSNDNTKEKELEGYRQFIIDVIKDYTPSFHVGTDLESFRKGKYRTEPWLLEQVVAATRNSMRPGANAFDKFFASNQQKIYCAFVLGLFNETIRLLPREGDGIVELHRGPIQESAYRLLSNYPKLRFDIRECSFFCVFDIG